MNEKVQEIINKMKEEESRLREEKKNNHLISLGLIDEEKSFKSKKYIEKWDGTQNCHWDKDKQSYYIETEIITPMKVTDEEYQEILKYSTFVEEKVENREINTTWATAIKTIANILFVVNILGGIILAIVLDENFAWISIVSAISYCVLYYPLIMGFSKIVAVSEIKLQQ